MTLQRQLTLSHLAVTVLSVTILLMGAIVGYAIYLNSDLPAVEAADLAIFHAEEFVVSVYDDGWDPQDYVNFHFLVVSAEPELDDWLIITDRNGEVIASNLPDRYPSGFQIERDLPPGTFEGEFGHPDEVLSATWNDTPEALYTNLGDGYVGQSPIILESGEWDGWVYFFLTTAIDRQLQEQLTRYGLLASVGLALIGVMVAGVMGYVLAGQFGTRLDSLGSATARFASGDRQARVEVNGSDEISQLGLRYNEMADTIENQITELQDLAETNAHLAVEAEGLARVEERNRLARELHDAIKQQLFGLNLTLGSLPALIEKKPELARSRVEMMIDQTKTIQTELDNIIHQLRPASLADQGLSAALIKLTSEWETQVGVPVHLEQHQSRALPLDLEQAVYRLIQEALQNTGKHAQANRVDISLDFGQHDLTVTYVDDGIGFDPQLLTGPGHGLYNMRNRIESLNGDFSIVSQPNQGCKITVKLMI